MLSSLSARKAARAFTLLEVALIVAIIGMMLMIIVGYLMAPKDRGPLPPVAATTPMPSSTAPTFTPRPQIEATPAPATPAAAATPAPEPAPAPAPASTPAPPQTIDLSPQGSPIFR